MTSLRGTAISEGLWPEFEPFKAQPHSRGYALGWRPIADAHFSQEDILLERLFLDQKTGDDVDAGALQLGTYVKSLQREAVQIS